MSTYAVSPPSGARSFDSAKSPISLGCAVDHEDRARGVGQVRVVELGVEAVDRDRDVRAPSSLPALRTVMLRSERLASFCLVGKLASTTSTWNSPSGSFSSWRSPPPQAARPSASAAHTARRALPPRLQSGRTYHAVAPCTPHLTHVVGFADGKGGTNLVRAVADRAFLPTKNLLEQVGDMMILTGKTVVSAVRPPYPYGTEFVQQFLFALRLCWLPLTISTIAFGYGAPGLQAGNFLVLFGAIDRLGGFFVLASHSRVRAVCDGDHPRRGRRDRDHRRSRGPQDPRGARRARRCWVSIRSRTSSCPASWR